MTKKTDKELLLAYAERGSESAFAELVRRYLDFVYSAAFRMVRNPQLAEDVAQSVLVALSQNSHSLASRPVLSGWLHRTAQNIAANAVRTEVRRRAREQEGAAMSEPSYSETGQAWERLAPHLDGAIGDLRAADRDVVLLRFFQGLSACQIAQALGLSEEAAQKRASRALERLRSALMARGSAIPAALLMSGLAAHSVQAAPFNLAATISAAASLGGTAVQAPAIIGATETIAMTTLQKSLITATLAATLGTGIFEARQASGLRGRVQTLQQRQVPLTEQAQRLKRDHDEMALKVAVLEEENQRLRQMTGEMPKLRGEVARLRALELPFAQSKSTDSILNDPFTQSILELSARAAELNQHLQLRPDKKIPELQFLAESDWLDAARDTHLESDTSIRQALSKLRSLAKAKFATLATHALDEYIRANNGQLPTDLSQLKQYFAPPVDDAILQRYYLLHSGRAEDLPTDAWVFAEKAPADKDYDSHLYVGANGRSTTWATGLGEIGDPDPAWTTQP